MALTFTSALALSQVKRPFMAVSEIKPGMRGYGLTVFRGETPERFGVEVIDVLHQFRPDQDLVLIRTEHPVLERATTVAGMSGSPVYIDDRLIGAYAYGWQFGKEPIVGVTPIANMLAELVRPIDPQIWRALGTLPIQAKTPAVSPRARHAPSERPFAALHAHPLAPDASPAQTRWGQPLPAATPLQVSGLGRLSTELLARELGDYGLWPVQAGASGGSAQRTASAAPRFVDGGAIGVQLVRGDISIMAVGTVTHVSGQRLVAFGHPMLNAGQVGLPTSTARVVHVLASLMRSFKLAEPGSPLGTLVHDRQAAIVVDQQLQADMLPVRVRLHGLPETARSEWKLELANHRMITPGLLQATLMNALETSASDRTDSVISVESRVRLAGRPQEVSSDIVYTPAGPSDAGALGRLRMFAVLNAAYANPFEAARVTGVDIDMHVRFDRDVLSLVDAQLPSDSVDPGSDVQLALTLRHYDEREHVELVSIHIPKSAAGESLELQIEPGDEVDVERPKPSSLDDILRALRPSFAGTSLVISTKLPTQGVKLRGQLVRSLPGSAIDTLQAVNESDRGALFWNFDRKELPLGHAVTGSAKLKINVRAEPLR